MHTVSQTQEAKQNQKLAWYPSPDGREIRVEHEDPTVLIPPGTYNPATYKG